MRRYFYPPVAVLALALSVWLAPWQVGTAEAQSITFRAAASAGVTPNVNFRAAGTVASAASGNVTPGLPTGWQPNDIHILIVEQKDNVVSTAPAGWTLLNAADSGTAHRASLWWRRAVAGDTDPTVTHAAGNSIIARIIGFYNVDTTTAFDVTNSFTVSAADKTTEAGAITTVTTNAMLVFTAHMADNHASIGLPTPGTWTEAFFSATAAGTDSSIAAHYSNLKSPPGAQAAVAATRAGAADAISHGAQLALRPAPVPLTINKPTGTVQNDVMIASIAVRASTVTITPPSGWTLVRRMDNADSTANSLAVYRLVAGASEPADYTWTFSPAAMAAGGIQTFSGVDTTTPIDVENGQNTVATPCCWTTSHPTPDVTTTVANTMLVTSHGVANPDTWEPPTGMTEAFDVLGGSEAVEGNYVLQAAAGPTGAKEATSATADVGNAHILALRPLCPTLPGDASYLSALAQTGTTNLTVRWSSPTNPVLILRKSTAFTGADNLVHGTDYIVGNTVGGATVVFKGTGGETSFTEAGPAATNNETSRYHYKAFPRTGSGASTCYAQGLDTVNASPPAETNTAWGYMMGGGSILKGGMTGTGTLYSSSNASRILSLSTANGTENWSAISTNAPIQGWLSWLPTGSGGVRSVQTGTTTMAVGATGTTQTVNVGAAQGFAGVTDLTKSVLFFSLKVSATDPADGQVRGQLTSTTNIQFERANDTSLSAVTIRWYVVEFYGGVRVQRGTLPTVNATSSVTLATPVALSKSFVLISCMVVAADVTYDSNDFFRGQLTSSSNLEIVHGGGGDKTCDWQVVEYAGASVQRGTGTLASTATSSGPIGISSVDTTKSFVHVTWITDGATSVTGANFLRARLTGAASIEIDRAATGSTITYAWEVVSFTDGTTVQSSNLVFSSAQTSLTAGISVDTTRSVAFLSAYQRGGRTAYTTDDNVGPGWFTATITSATVVTVEREITGSAAADTFWVVIEFAPPGATTGPVVFGGDQGTGVADSARLYSVDATVGVKNWEVALTGADRLQDGISVQVRAWSNAAYQAHPTVGAHDVVFAATRNALGSFTTNNRVFARRASDGGSLWTFSPGNMDIAVGQPWVDYGRNYLYVTSRSAGGVAQPSLWVLSTLDGSLVQSFALNDVDVSPTMSFTSGALYVGNKLGNLYAIDLNTLALKWGAPLALGSEGVGTIWEDAATPGRLYFATADGAIRCVQDNGSSASACAGWTNATVAGPNTPLVLDRLYVGSTDGKVYQINLTTGAIETSCTVGDGTKVVGNMSTETGSELFVGTSEGKIYKFTALPLPSPTCP